MGDNDNLESILTMQDNIHQMSNVSQLLVHNVSLSIKQLQSKDRYIVNKLYNELYTKLLGIMSFLTNPEFTEKLLIKEIVSNILVCDILKKETKCIRALLFRDLLKKIYAVNSLNAIDWNVTYELYSQNIFKYFQLIVEDILLSIYSLNISCDIYNNYNNHKCKNECEFKCIYVNNEIILFITIETKNIIDTIQKYINVCKHYISKQKLTLVLDFKIITSSLTNLKHVKLDKEFLDFCNNQSYFKHIIIRNTGYIDYMMNFDSLYTSIKNNKISIDVFN